MGKILLIEDDVDIQKIYGEALKKQGHDVTTVSTAEKGLSQVLSPTPPNIIILDIILPQGMNGFDFLEKIKDMGLVGKIPVIVLTNLESEKEVARSIGVTEYIIKANTTPKLIVEKVQNILKKRQ